MSTRFLIAILSLVILGGALILFFESKDEPISPVSSINISINEPDSTVDASGQTGVMPLSR